MSKPANRDKFMGVLDDVNDSESDDSHGSPSATDTSDKEAAEDERKDPVAKRKKLELSVEDLEKAGYKSGPSIKFMKPPVEETQTSWNWSKGKETKGKEDSDDDPEERAATRAAVTQGLEHSAQLAVKSMEYAAQLREEARAEKERLAQEKRLSFNQKEKRKRDAGQTSRAKNFVEESKRQAREYGVYSGFD